VTGHQRRVETARRAGWRVEHAPRGYRVLDPKGASRGVYKFKETAELAMIGKFERPKSRSNPLNEADYVMGGVVLIAVIGTVYFLATRPSVTTSPQIPANPDAEPPFVPGA
jgi:hypothetical protein